MKDDPRSGPSSVDEPVDEQPADKHPDFPFGRPGRPLRSSPFMWGLTGTLGVATAWLLVQAIVSARSVLILIVVAMFLAVGLNPTVEALQGRNVPRGLAIVLVFAGVVGFFVLLGFAIVPPVTEQTAQFVDAVPGYVTELQNNTTIRQLDKDYQILKKAQDYITSGGAGGLVFGGIVGVGQVVLNAFFSFVTVLILTLYFLGSLSSIKEFFYSLVPASRRARARLIGDEILDGIGGYVAGNVFISLLAGLVTWGFLAIVQVKYALALALVRAILGLVPLVGGGLGVIIVTAVAFLQSIPVGIATGIFLMAYLQLENYWILPRVMKKSVDVAPAVVIIAALLGGTLLGIVGALLAIPVAAAIALILREVVMPRQARA